MNEHSIFDRNKSMANEHEYYTARPPGLLLDNKTALNFSICPFSVSDCFVFVQKADRPRLVGTGSGRAGGRVLAELGCFEITRSPNRSSTFPKLHKLYFQVALTESPVLHCHWLTELGRNSPRNPAIQLSWLLLFPIKIDLMHWEQFHHFTTIPSVNRNGLPLPQLYCWLTLNVTGAMQHYEDSIIVTPHSSLITQAGPHCLWSELQLLWLRSVYPLTSHEPVSPTLAIFTRKSQL